jgi:DNA-binding CsgD family transcriptional regulator/tetratricopeptide (TPR) repeat protein
MPAKTGLIERDAQLAELGAWLSGTRAGRGGLVLVTGEAGAGKTRLVRTALAHGAVPALFADATQEATEPYAPIASLIRAHLRVQPESLRAAGPLAPYLSLIVPEHGSEQLAPSATALVDALSAWFAGLGEGNGLAVFLDDMQWADSATLDLLGRLAADLESVPVVVIAAYRNDEVTRSHPVRKLRVVLRRSAHLAEIEVEALRAAGTAELATRLLRAPVAPSLAAVLYDRTQGVPFFVEELVAALSAEALLAPGPDGLTVRSGGHVPVPDNVRDAVLLRAEQLSDRARSALEAAAVVGQRFALDVIAEVGTAADFEEASALGFVAEVQPGTAAFRHTLVREAVYAAVPWPRRRDIHGKVASALGRRGAPPRLVAEHWLAAAEHDRARVALVAAADASCAVHAYRDASGALRQALDLWPNGDDEARLDLTERLARCAERSGEPREAVRLWESIAREAALIDPRRHAAAKRDLAVAYRLLGNRDRAAAVGVEAADAFAAAGAFAEAAEVRLNVAWDREADPSDAAFEALEAAERDARRCERIDLVAQALGRRGHFLARRGRFDEGAAMAAEGLELARYCGVPSVMFAGYWFLAAIGLTRADYRGAVAVLEEAAELCRATGLREDEELCIACLAKILSKQGEWDRALELAHDVLRLADQLPGVRWAALWAAGSVYVARGRTAEGRPLLAELTMLGRRLRFRPALLEGLQGLALADELEGDLESAADRHREVIEAAGTLTTDAHHFAPTLRWAATFFAMQGNAEQVNACAAALADIAAWFGSADTLAALAHVSGEASLLAGDAQTSAREFGHALELFDELGAPFEAAVTKLRAGPAFVAAGERDVGVGYVVDAYRCFRRLGARPFIVRAAAVLEGLGEAVDRRFGRRAAGDLERGGLTRRELEVLRLVAVGRTNSEIAHELVLSPRTVEMHVRNTLAKLDCRSRTEATSRAHTLGLVGKAHVRSTAIPL